jgi:integrase
MSSQVSVKNLKGHPNYKYRVTYPDGNQRKSKYFKIKTGKKGADAWATEKREKLKLLGSKEEAISSAELRAVYYFREEVRKLPKDAQNYTLDDAIKSFVQSLQSRHKSITCEEVAANYVDTLRAEQKSERHIETTDGRMKKFNAEYGDWLACDVTTEVIDDFLTNLKSTPRKKKEKKRALGVKSKNNYRLTLSGMFSRAVKLKAASNNPVEDAIKFKEVSTEVSVLEPQEVAALLHAADDATRAGLAISFFAGLRRSEIEELDWSNIDLEEKLIKVTALNSKTSERRLVSISDNLKKWLTPLYRNRGGVTDTPAKWRRGCEKAREAAKIAVWPSNAGRHSFASYYLAAYEDAGKTAFQLGHKGDVTMLHNHYKAVVTQKKALAFWAIAPDNSDKITNIKSA